MFNPNGTTTLFCLDGAGNFHRLDTTVRPLGPRSDLLLAASGDQGHTIRNAARMGDAPVHFYGARDPGIAVVMPCLSIRTYYIAQGSGESLCLTPHFNAEGAVELRNDWFPPEDCKLVFVCRQGNCYLLAIHTDGAGKKRICRLPLPNIHDDGRICMGNWAPPDGLSMMDRLSNALTFFSTSMWNNDLMNSEKRERIKMFMRFSVDGKQLPATEAWSHYSPVIASAIYNWVVEAV